LFCKTFLTSRWTRFLASRGSLAGLLLGVAILVAASAGSAMAQPENPQKQIDAWNTLLEKVDAAIERDGTSDVDFKNLKQQVTEIVEAANALADVLAPKVAAATAQVEQLKPTGAADAPESEAAKQNRQEAEKQLADLVGFQKQALATASHGSYALSQIGERRRTRFTAALLERNTSLIDPALWGDAASDLPSITGRTGSVVGEWASVVVNRSDRSIIAVFVSLLALIVAVLVPGRRFLLSKLRRSDVDYQPTMRTKVISAAAIVVVNAFLPLVVLTAGKSVLGALELLPYRVDLLWLGATAAIVFFSLAFGVSRALLAPTRSTWRLVSLDDTVAMRAFRFSVAIAAVQALVIFHQSFAKVTQASLAFTIALDGIASIVIAILVILMVRVLTRRAEPSEEEGDDAADDDYGLGRLALMAAGLASGGAILANLMGYVALGRFLTTQTVWTAVVISLLYLLMKVTDEVTAASFRRDGLVGSRLITSVGFAPRSVTQAGVLANGVAHLVLIGLAFLAIVAQWGVDSSGLFATIRQLFFGFKIGSITISLSTLVAGIVVFLIGLIITRSIQNWLDTRFLPTTRLDSGLRNSIRTSVGYVGMIFAATLAFGYAGLDLSNIAIVAGALSVGIGLGLQAIVNNFVSGLILLAERPIRAGDWITVGAEEGTVKRINVRATEIETFDRATVIVPNSSLITGVVKNMVLRDRSGRVVVPVTVSKLSDAEQVKTILIECAKAHSLVLRYPEPIVLFLNFGEKALDFELRCYLADIATGATVRSDLRFAILSRLKEEGVALPG
jgi:potassium efflux system protein